MYRIFQTIAFASSLLLSIHLAQASYLINSKTSATHDPKPILIEYPRYGTVTPDEPGSPPDLIDKLMRSKSCVPSEHPFQKMEDVNQHPYFPDLQVNPVYGDHLGTLFFKEKKTGKISGFALGTETISDCFSSHGRNGVVPTVDS